MRLTGILFLLIFIVFQSTHPLRGATRRSTSKLQVSIISIHAPLAGCDKIQATKIRLSRYFNPRTPCGVRLRPCLLISVLGYFNPRTPCGVRRPLPPRFPQHNRISIHAPLAGCDLLRRAPMSTRTISIHAPLAGCDFVMILTEAALADFNPRTPCGVRHAMERERCGGQAFQSTHPLRGATARTQIERSGTHISIHAPLAGCDVCPAAERTTAENFNPRTPCGVRLPCRLKLHAVKLFQSTHPLRGATGADEVVAQGVFISIHAPLAGCDSA